MAKYTEDSVVRSLSRNSDINIDRDHRIEVVKDSTLVGIHSLGKIDYLRKVHHYTVLFVNKLSRIGKGKKIVHKDDDKPINMAKMTKQMMKKYRI